jgi:hypothetical protein
MPNDSQGGIVLVVYLVVAAVITAGLLTWGIATLVR